MRNNILNVDVTGTSYEYIALCISYNDSVLLATNPEG